MPDTPRALAGGREIRADALPAYKTASDVRIVFRGHPDPNWDQDEVDATMYRVVHGTSPGHIWNYRRTEFDDTARGHETASIELVLNEDRWRSVQTAFPVGFFVGDMTVETGDRSGDWLVEGHVPNASRRIGVDGANYVSVTVVFRRRRPLADRYRTPRPTPGPEARSEPAEARSEPAEAGPARYAVVPYQARFTVEGEAGSRAYDPDLVRALVAAGRRGDLALVPTGMEAGVTTMVASPTSSSVYIGPFLRTMTGGLENATVWDLALGRYLPIDASTGPQRDGFLESTVASAAPEVYDSLGYGRIPDSHVEDASSALFGPADA